MTLAMIAFTAQGMALGERLAGALRAQGEAVSLARGYSEGKQPLAGWTRSAMRDCDGLIFIGATGIAVRAIAPNLRGKLADPAVVVIDEGGRFAISLLSGHAGGANRLAARAAEAIGATLVITTATDGRGLFAVDVWAKARGIALANPGAVKAVSGALLAGRPVGVSSDFPVAGAMPAGLVRGGGPEVGLHIGIDLRKAPFPLTLYAAPRVLALGIGCRRGVLQETLEAQVDRALARLGAVRAAVCAVATIDRKAEEPGLLALCGANGWPLRVFSAGALRAVPGTYTASRLVEETVGVDNVCERAAVAVGGGLLLAKQAENGVTVAVSALPYTVSFEGGTDACTSRW